MKMMNELFFLFCLVVYIAAKFIGKMNIIVDKIMMIALIIYSALVNVRYGFIVCIFLIAIYHYKNNMTDYKESFDQYDQYGQSNQLNQPIIHVLLATIGKDSIFGMLGDVKAQLVENDYITIVFDGPKSKNVEKVREFCKDFRCKVNVIVEDTNLGYWGHGIRNKHRDLTGDFVFHVDDDDSLPANSLDIIRRKCVNKDTIYIFKMQTKNGVIWKTKEVKLNEIGTPMGIVPTSINKTGIFTLKYGGDYEFYKQITENRRVEFMDDIIYHVSNK